MVTFRDFPACPMMPCLRQIRYLAIRNAATHVEGNVWKLKIPIGWQWRHHFSAPLQRKWKWHDKKAALSETGVYTHSLAFILILFLWWGKHRKTMTPSGNSTEHWEIYNFSVIFPYLHGGFPITPRLILGGQTQDIPRGSSQKFQEKPTMALYPLVI